TRLVVIPVLLPRRGLVRPPHGDRRERVGRPQRACLSPGSCGPLARSHTARATRSDYACPLACPPAAPPGGARTQALVLPFDLAGRPCARAARRPLGVSAEAGSSLRSHATARVRRLRPRHATGSAGDAGRSARRAASPECARAGAH